MKKFINRIDRGNDINTENGNVIFIIFIGIALFAALSFSVGNMLRGSPEAISKERANIFANEVLDYARTIREAIQYMRISNGCAVDEISFENTELDDAGYTYTNANAPGDDSCDVFHPSGGDVKYQTPQSDFYAGGSGGVGFTEHWAFTGNMCIRNIGGDDVCSASEAELIMFLAGVNPQICQRINEKLDVVSIGGAIPDQNITIAGANTFQGTYSGSNTAALTIGFTDPGPLVGQPAGCVNDDTGNPGGYIFYYSLLDR